jgi:hypothetical protein
MGEFPGPHLDGVVPLVESPPITLIILIVICGIISGMLGWASMQAVLTVTQWSLYSFQLLVLIQVKANALCSSELPQYRNGSEVTPGHEAAGIIAMRFAQWC